MPSTGTPSPRSGPGPHSPLEVRDDRVARIADPSLHTLWINTVPEAKVVKDRVHLDLVPGRRHSRCSTWAPRRTTTRAASSWCRTRAATRCACSRATPAVRSPVRSHCASTAPSRSRPHGGGTTCWAGTSATAPTARRATSMTPPAWAGSCSSSCRSTIGGIVKNRCHWDVTTDDVDQLVARGATRRARPDGDDTFWTVLADPQGNEFCAFEPG